MQSLERLVDERIKLFPVTNETGKLMMFLERIKQYHAQTYRHSLRVGLKCMDAARIFEYNEKEMLYSGLLHDIGKIAVPVETLDKRGGFGSEDYREIEIHPLYAYNMLYPGFPFIAEVVLRHHRAGKRPYPKKLPVPRACSRLKEICSYARLLSIIDCYDAMTRRHDNYPLEAHNPRDALMAERKGMEAMIERLFGAKILA